MEKKCNCPEPDTIRTGTLERIERFGFTYIGVPPGLGGLGLVYTIGLTRKDLPELFMSFSFDTHAAQKMLDVVAQAFIEGKTELGRREDLFNVPVILVELAPSIFDTHMGWSKEIMTEDFGYSDLRAVQVIWPDVNGKFPGDVPPEEFAGGQQLMTPKIEPQQLN
jgi:hypothetical protein